MENENKLQEEIAPIAEYAGNIVIKSDLENQAAGEKLKQIKTLQKKIKAELDPIVKKSYDAYKANLEFRKKHEDPLKKAEKDIKAAIAGFIFEQEEKARKLQAELEAKAREQEEKKKAELEKRADKWDSKGKPEKAELLRDEAILTSVIAPVVNSGVSKVEGVHTVEVWKHRVINKKELPREYMVPDDKMLSQLAKATKGSLKIPGVEFYSEKSIAAKSF